MASDLASAFEDLGERFQFQISARCRHLDPTNAIPQPTILHVPLMFHPAGLVFPSLDEHVVIHLLDAHPRLGKPRTVIFPPIRLLDILSEREFDEARRILEEHSSWIFSPPKLDQGALAADGICRAVKQLCCGDSTR